MSRLIKHSFTLAGHRTSVALEPAFWDVLHAIAAARAMTLLALVMEVDAGRAVNEALASALRVYALKAQR